MQQHGYTQLCQGRYTQKKRIVKACHDFTQMSAGQLVATKWKVFCEAGKPRAAVQVMLRRTFQAAACMARASLSTRISVQKCHRSARPQQRHVALSRHDVRSACRWFEQPLERALCSQQPQQLWHNLYSMSALLARSTWLKRLAASRRACVREWQVPRCCTVCLQYLVILHEETLCVRLVFGLCRLLAMRHGGSKVAAGGLSVIYVDSATS